LLALQLAGAYDPHVQVEERLEQLGLVLPPPIDVPAGVRLPFAPARIRGSRVVLSGHGPQAPDGSIAGLLGKVPDDVTVEDAYAAARLTALSMLGTLKRELGDLDRVTAWVRVFGMVNSSPGFTEQPAVVNGFSDLILELYGSDVGAHARSAIGVAALPFGMPVEVEAEIEID
jgi:enamine deaminase RidA (YjgF/YER057c/UK114 family)